MTKQTDLPIRVIELAGSVALYGAERWILALARHMNRDKVRPVIAALKDGDEESAPICDAAGQLGLSSVLIEAPGRFDLGAVRRLRSLIADEEASFVHTHGYKGDLIGRLATWGTPCRILATPHGWTHNPDTKLRLYEALDRAVFPLMDGVAPLSEEMHRDLAKNPAVRSKLRLITNAVDLDEIAAHNSVAPDILAWRKGADFVVGFIGRIIQDKGIATLLRAAAKLATPGLRIALVGAGPDENSFIDTARSLGIADQVRFFGYQKDRLAYMKAFDVMALPSLSEGIPRCVMEAMGLGVPVVASDIPGCRALIQNRQTGLLTAPGDEAALAEALEFIRNNPAARIELAVAARQRVYADFSAKSMAEKYENLFMAMLGRPAPVVLKG